MSEREVVYLGPQGTYAHEVARKRFARDRKLVPCDSIGAVCQRVASNRSRMGVVPVENSSGGTIYPTIDALLDKDLSLNIQEEMTIDVHLALMGRKGKPVKTIYSHFAPKRHCEKSIEKDYPNVEWIEVGSTGAALREASHVEDSAGIGCRRAAKLYGLDVLSYPLASDIPNVTRFLILSKDRKVLPRVTKTSLAVHLPNISGSLLRFLSPFANHGLNLSRIVSRPIPGEPEEAAFFIDVQRHADSAKFSAALKQASKEAHSVRVLGSYPSFRSYTS